MYKYTPIMTGLSRRLGTLAIYLVLALAALALPVEASQPVHFHDGVGPGLYNAECLLATVAAFQGAAPLPSAPASVSITLSADPALVPAVDCFFTPLAPHTDPRAPPSA